MNVKYSENYLQWKKQLSSGYRKSTFWDLKSPNMSSGWDLGSQRGPKSPWIKPSQAILVILSSFWSSKMNQNRSESMLESYENLSSYRFFGAPGSSSGSQNVDLILKNSIHFIYEIFTHPFGYKTFLFWISNFPEIPLMNILFNVNFILSLYRITTFLFCQKPKPSVP